MNRGPHAVHPSPFALEQHLAGEADPAVTSHLADCETCRARLHELEAAGKKFSASPRSLRARTAARTADRQWKQKAAALVVTPLAALVLVGIVLRAPPPAPTQELAVKTQEPAKVRQGRELLDPRQEPWRTSMRSIPLRGHKVEFGQGSLEAALGDGPARPFTLQHTKVDIAVTGFLQAVTVTQTFHNPFSSPVEAIYVFPLPDDAAVHDMTLTAGGRVIKAVIQKRGVARQQYEEAKAQGRRAALLDQERPNIFTQSLANLLPGEQVSVTLQYVAPLRYDDGVYTLNFPMVVGARYVPGAVLPGESQGSGSTGDTDVVPDASRISPPAARSGRDIEVAVHLEAGTVIEDLWSVSHRLEVDRPSSSKMDLALHPLDTLPNKDLVVRWRVSGTQARAAMLAAGGAFALMLNPEGREQNTPATPKEMVFVIDTSCSMNGAPLNAAKRAMGQALQQMNPDDTFMLIDFASRASSFHDAPLPATPTEVRRALGYLQALPSGGSTNQLAGLRRALARPEDPRRVRMVLLMTDGFIGNEEEIFAETRKLRGRARVFGFGIGSSVNHFLLSRLSEEGRGFYQYIRPDEDAAEAVTRFTRRVARPLITDISIDWGGLDVADTVPELVPDLFDAQPLIIQGRYRVAGSGTVVLRGSRNGQPVVFEVPVTLPALSTDGHALQMAWARRRIETLSVVQHNVELPEVVQQITALGLEFHLVTKYTSLVAVAERRVTNQPTGTVTEPTLVPDQTTVVAGHGLLGVKGGEQKNKELLLALDGLSGGEGQDGSRLRLGDLLGNEQGQPSGSGGLGMRGVGAGGGGSVVLSGKGGGNRFAPATPTPDAPQLRAAGVAAALTGERSPLPEPVAGPMPVDAPPPPPVVATTVPKRTGTGSGSGAGKSFDRSFNLDKAAVADPNQGPSQSSPSPSSEILEVIIKNRAELAVCVERQRLVNPALHGTLVMKWVIKPDGTTTTIEVLTRELENTEIARCVTKVISRYRYRAHQVQGAPVTFPFKF